MCHSRVFSILILETLNKCIVLHSLKCARGCPTLRKYFHVKSSWMWYCCRYHVVFHCIVSYLAMFHNLVFSQQAHNFALSKMFSRVSHGWKICLREKCVDVGLLSISCNFLPLHRLAFSDVPQSRFESRDPGSPQQVHNFASFEIFWRVSQAWKISLREKCVDVILLSISCSFQSLRRLALSYVSQSHFQSPGV